VPSARRAVQPPTALSRARQGRWLAGVCAGVARHRDLPVGSLRAAFGIAALFGGLGVLVYVACWLIIPAVGDADVGEGPRGIVVLAQALAICAASPTSWPAARRTVASCSSERRSTATAVPSATPQIEPGTDPADRLPFPGRQLLRPRLPRRRQPTAGPQLARLPDRGRAAAQRGRPRRSARGILKAWRKRRAVEVRSARLIDRLLPGPCSPRNAGRR
jgi:phage shock protein PspC (stress-responsive transcriptional regulator)